MNKSLKRALQKIAQQPNTCTCPICGEKGIHEHNSSRGDVVQVGGVSLCRYADFTYPSCGHKTTEDRLTGETKQRGVL